MKHIIAPALEAALLLASPLAQSAELKVLSGNGAKAAVRELCTQFERATGHSIALRFEVNTELQRKLEAGEAFDVAVGNPPVIDALIKAGKVVAGSSSSNIGSAGLGVAVRSGAPKPDIGSVDAFKRALLAANAVAFPGEGASGRYFVSLVERMGIAAEMKSKLKPMAAEDTVEVVARGDADMVVVVSSRIYDVAGVDPVGPIPPGVANPHRLRGGLKRVRQRAGGGQGADPVSHRAGSKPHAEGQGRRAAVMRRPAGGCRRPCWM